MANRRKTDTRTSTSIRTNNLYKAIIDANTTIYSSYRTGMISKLLVLDYLPIDGSNTVFRNMYTNKTTKIITYHEAYIDLP